MTSYIRILSMMFLFTFPAFGQASPSLFAKAFISLGEVHIQNEIMITNSKHLGVVVLFKQSSGEGISLISMTDGQVRTIWHLAQLPAFMSVIDPSNLRVTTTEDGPVILLHGCALHLCGGKGLAGALTYVVNEHRVYTGFASWSSSTGTAKVVYSPHDATLRYEGQRKLLDSMLREEHYTP
jgi:hypothetical protein